MSNPTPQKYVDMAQEILKPFVLAVYPVEKMPNGIIMTVALALQTSHDEGVREENKACYEIALKGIDLGVAADILLRRDK